MARKPAPKPIGTTLPHDWRDDGRWKIAAMLAKVPPSDYLPEARSFENHHLAAGTLSADWAEMWKTWCKDRLVAQIRKHLDPSVFEDAPETEGLFSAIR